MPSIFISENINLAIEQKNNTNLLLYSIVSLNNKEWKGIHPNHLRMILNGILNINKKGKKLKILLLKFLKIIKFYND